VPTGVVRDAGGADEGFEVGLGDTGAGMISSMTGFSAG
jgi:hypothetical protein